LTMASTRKEVMSAITTSSRALPMRRALKLRPRLPR
jgi:hypothetical protein